MTNLTHDELIAYALAHDDERIRDLANRFMDYRDVINRYIVAEDMTIDETVYEPVWPVDDVPMFLKKQGN